MELKVIGPGPKSLDLRPLLWYIEKCLKEIKKDGEFLIVSALADGEGLNLLNDALEHVTGLECIVKAVIGINLGISKDTLQKLNETFGNQDVFIYYNPADSTFHPKMYLIRADDSTGTVIIGSSNLTSAGFLRNFEVNIGLRFDLHIKKERRKFQRFVETFNALLKEKSTRPLTKKLQSELEKRTKRIAKPAAEAESTLALSKVFEGENHGWKIPAFQGKRTFLMTLSYNDVSGVRGDQYIRIPVNAVNLNSAFWRWPKSFSRSASGYPQRFLNISYLRRNYRYRFYFAAGPDEFRLVMPQIYSLGASYEGSILKISRRQNRYLLELILRRGKNYTQHIKQCTAKSPRGQAAVSKMWGYV